MDDADIIRRIGELADEEHRLEAAHAAGDVPTDVERTRLQELEVALDRCWDLLRQRRARRRSGLDPDDATLRPEETVEGYRQ